MHIPARFYILVVSFVVAAFRSTLGHHTKVPQAIMCLTKAV